MLSNGQQYGWTAPGLTDGDHGSSLITSLVIPFAIREIPAFMVDRRKETAMRNDRLTLQAEDRCVVALTFDNFGESYDLLQYGHAGGASADGVYAPRRGVGRILDLLDTYRVPATFFMEGWNARKYAELAREVARRGHEIAAHGWMHERWDSLDVEREAELIRRTTQVISEVTGAPPRGWRSPGGLTTPNTLPLLKQAGYQYDSSFGDDDFPYLMQVQAENQE